MPTLWAFNNIEKKREEKKRREEDCGEDCMKSVFL